MNYVSYKLHELSVCLMCFQMLVCINHFLQFTPSLLRPFKSVKQGFYCTHKRTSTVWASKAVFLLPILQFLNKINCSKTYEK
jgi:hypothetical protein